MTSRRQYLFGTGTVTAALLGVGPGTALAQNAAPDGIYFTDVFADQEYLVIENRGESEVNLEEYYINFEYNGEQNQIRQFGADAEVASGADLTFEPGERLVIATGAESVPEAHITFNYEGPVINNDTPDSFALLMPDGETVVAAADKNPSPPPTDTPTSEEATTTETDTTTQTTTETATQTTTETSTDTATASTPDSETTTAESTGAATETPDGSPATDAPSGDDC